MAQPAATGSLHLERDILKQTLAVTTITPSLRTPSGQSHFLHTMYNKNLGNLGFYTPLANGGRELATPDSVRISPEGGNRDKNKLG